MLVKNGQEWLKNKKTQTAYEPPSVKVKKIKSNINDKEENKKIKLIEEQLKKNKLTKPVIIPEEVNVSNVKKVKTKPIEVQEKLKKDQLYPVIPTALSAMGSALSAVTCRSMILILGKWRSVPAGWKRWKNCPKNIFMTSAI